jgi:hypothetical protein
MVAALHEAAHQYSPLGHRECGLNGPIVSEDAPQVVVLDCLPEDSPSKCVELIVKFPDQGVQHPQISVSQVGPLHVIAVRSSSDIASAGSSLPNPARRTSLLSGP